MTPLVLIRSLSIVKMGADVSTVDVSKGRHSLDGWKVPQVRGKICIFRLWSRTVPVTSNNIHRK